ncbi:MAG TPA: ribonuclease H-like domain-containing protein [Bryobacteraceae bacterium]|nr:ribonuclease H-like domain-containing protein [Bryobacteraceae bacterium]
MPRKPATPTITQFLTRFKTKAAIIAVSKLKCKHGRSFIDHYRCYERAYPTAAEAAAPERIGVMDLECSGLQSDYSQLLTWVILDSATGEVYKDQITPSDIRSGIEDRRIVASLIEAMKSFTLLCGHYSTRFDIPYIRARALIHGLEFPPYGSIKHFDTYFLCRSKFKLSSRRLDNLARFLLGKSDKTRVDARYWRDGLRGDPKAIRYILDHNRKDVVMTEKLYNAIVKFKRPTATSI